MPTYDDLKDRPSGGVERQYGSGFEFAYATVMKRQCRLKNLQSEFAAKTARNINVALLLGKIRLEYLYNF